MRLSAFLIFVFYSCTFIAAQAEGTKFSSIADMNGLGVDSDVQSAYEEIVTQISSRDLVDLKSEFPEISRKEAILSNFDFNIRDFPGIYTKDNVVYVPLSFVAYIAELFGYQQIIGAFGPNTPLNKRSLVNYLRFIRCYDDGTEASPLYGDYISAAVEPNQYTSPMADLTSASIYSVLLWYISEEALKDTGFASIKTVEFFRRLGVPPVGVSIVEMNRTFLRSSEAPQESDVAVAIESQLSRMRHLAAEISNGFSAFSGRGGVASWAVHESETLFEFSTSFGSESTIEQTLGPCAEIVE